MRLFNKEAQRHGEERIKLEGTRPVRSTRRPAVQLSSPPSLHVSVVMSVARD